ncbi:hypothetical protein EVAR_42018_1 [Eumeta japonica]|uniref:Uncharacterized protein n=1 Tax=Eumeta variegata TaxID=151549 RepID=A0A4C1WPS8_EUMVA|nr:hypothetical protein EVAR_42018_1 [Eumeta japonica]
MSVKLHFLDSHVDSFPENLGAVSEEQGERLHHDTKEMEKRYQERWDIIMKADYYWILKRDSLTKIKLQKAVFREKENDLIKKKPAKCESDSRTEGSV